jgi:ABC-type sugar transport system ATPase subunit
MLTARGICKNYGGIAALRSVDFDLDRGEIHGLCGENGAGKSTLVKILGGLVAQSSGEVEVSGVVLKPGRRTDPRLISIVHQELSIVPDLSVLDNVLLGDERVGELYLRGRFAADVRRQLDALGLVHVEVDQKARNLTLAERQLVEITRGVIRGARILILDEPTATLSDNEIGRVFSAVRWLRDSGTTIVFISHRLPEIFELTDRVTVFRNGEKVLTRATRELTSGELVRAMIGRDVQSRDLSRSEAVQASAPRLRLNQLALLPKFHPVDLAFGRGEIVAIVGQLGSGADLIVETLAGARGTYTGSIWLEGEELEARSPRAALAHGISYVPEDRAGKGVFLDAAVETNISASILDRLSRFGVIQRTLAASKSRQLAMLFQIDPKRLPSDVSQLSGGNQQKVALAKAVARDPSVLILNEPTRGVDIGARAEIYKQIRALAGRGMLVIFFTTDIEEVHELADRVITVFRGSIVADRATAEAHMNDVLADIIHGPHGGQAA